MAISSAKNGTGTDSFSQIRARELEESERVERELAVFERERQDVAKSAKEQEERSDTQAREAARAELKEFKEKEMSQLLSAAEKDAEAACRALKESCKKHQPQVVHALVERVTSGALFSSAA